jgi:DNA-binding NarL/FixJ family response regulator
VFRGSAATPIALSRGTERPYTLREANSKMAQPTLKRYDAVIIDPDMTTRSRLKQVCASVINFGRVVPIGSCFETMEQIRGDMRADVVFISHHIPQEQIPPFIKEAKNTPGGQDSAYILVLPTKEQASGDVAQAMMIGADGVLFEPYSVDILVEITLLAAKVRRERRAARDQATFKFLLNDLIQQIDVIAYSKSCGYEVGPAMKHFRQACAVLTTMEPDSVEIWYRTAIDSFEAAQIPSALLQRKKYGGASNRVKQRMSEKITAEIGKIAAANPPKTS